MQNETARYTVQFPGSSEIIQAPPTARTAEEAARWAIELASDRSAGKLYAHPTPDGTYYTTRRRIAVPHVTVREVYSVDHYSVQGKPGTWTTHQTL